MRLVKQNQAVGAGHGGVDRPPAGSIATKQKTGSVHRYRTEDYGRARGVRRGTRGNAPPKANHVQRGRGGIDPQRTKPLGDAPDDLARGAIQPRRFRIVERGSDVPRVFGRRVHEEASVDDPPDACRRGATLRCPVGLRRQPPHRDIKTGRLAEPGRHADFGRPPLLRHDLLGQTRLPWERLSFVDGVVELGERRQRRDPHPVRRRPCVARCQPCLSHRRARRGRNHVAARHRRRPVLPWAPQSGTRRGSTAARGAPGG